MSGQEVTAETPSVEPESPVSATFQFPLRKANGSQYDSAEELHTALQAENSGHYLLGSNGFWHGGVGYSPEMLQELSEQYPAIVHAYERNYRYGSASAQYERLKFARDLDSDSANKSCSWGKFQVVGEYFYHLYSSVDELVIAQNYCALQHLQYFKVFSSVRRICLGR